MAMRWAHFLRSSKMPLHPALRATFLVASSASSRSLAYSPPDSPMVPLIRPRVSGEKLISCVKKREYIGINSRDHIRNSQLRKREGSL